MVSGPLVNTQCLPVKGDQKLLLKQVVHWMSSIINNDGPLPLLLPLGIER